MILHGDCLDVLKTLNENSVDCLVTDPPYGIEFMGKKWDDALPSIEIWKEAYRVMKPGSFGFVACIPRQDCLSRMMISLEDAGFNINFSSIYWTYATGFPKAMNIGKMIDKRMGKKREIISTNKQLDLHDTISYESIRDKKLYVDVNVTAPASDLAKKMEGSYGGFQPKPAVEVIIVVMKPLSESGYLNQAMKDGKGVTWLDDCRVPYNDIPLSELERCDQVQHNKSNIDIGGAKPGDVQKLFNTEGRFPANLLVQDNIIPDVTKFFDLDAWAQKNLPFIIVPKAPKKEKNAGCEGLEESSVSNFIGCKKCGEASINTGNQKCSKCGATEDWKNPIVTKNNHPTVKPMKLMSYLITLGSRPGDVILDPFSGSGTTACSAIMLRRNWIAIEKEDEYLPIIESRVNYYINIKKQEPLKV